MQHPRIVPLLNQNQDLELIDDTALQTVEQDLLYHHNLAEELAELVCQVETPANIALFGPWGSGKSSLGNLLRSSLNRYKDVKFVRFDAFKYAETPLRRHFLSQVAEDLGIRDSKFTDDLYRSTVTSRFAVPKLEVATLLFFFVTILAAVGFLYLGLLAMTAWLSTGPFSRNFVNSLIPSLPSVLTPAALLAALIALAGKSFTIQRTIGAPSSDEEFERLFRDLVAKCKCTRLVIFVDELDRCSPEEVVSTLETIRTFLGVRKCVFVVAADQRVLEYALSLKLRQATPPDNTNPYYSAGSAYLDKVFQYQLEVPALFPRRLSRFALDLIKDRDGLWNDIDRELVISVLIPTHVRSPRRVKALLNNFVLAFRLARRRSVEGVLGGNLINRAPELAKLTCLKTEFPLFAADLVLDARLPRLVLDSLEDRLEIDSSHVSPLVVKRAKQYADKILPVDVLLTDESESEVIVEHSSSSGAASEKGTERVAAVQVEHGEQLIRYLQKTAFVQGPRHDLIHLESPGAVFGLEPEIAIALDENAANGRTAEVLDQLRKLDRADQLKSIQLLRHQVREASIGIEGQNAVSTILRVIGELNIDVSSVADEVADSIAMHQRKNDLREEDLIGAYMLGLASSRNIGSILLHYVLEQDAAVERNHLAQLVIKSADRTIDLFPDRLSEICASQLGSSDTASEAARIVSDLPVDIASRLLRLSGAELVERFRLDNETGTENDVDPEESAARRSEAFTQVLDVFLDVGKTPLAEHLAAIGISIDAREFRDVVVTRLKRFSPIQSVELSAAILVATRRRTISEWTNWFEPLVPELVASNACIAQFDELLTKLWKEIEGDEPPGDDLLFPLLKDIKRLYADLPNSEGAISLGERIATSIGGLASTALEVQEQERLLKAARRFCVEGIVSINEISSSILTNFTDSLADKSSPQDVGGQYKMEWIPWLLESADIESAKRFLEALQSTTWFPPSAHESLTILASAKILEMGEAVASPYSGAEVAELASSYGEDFSIGLASWILNFAQTSDAIWKAVRPIISQKIDRPVFDALQTYTGRLTRAECLEMARPVLEEAFELQVSQDYLEAIRFSEADQQGANELLIELYIKATNNEQREKVLWFWQSLRPTDERVKRGLIEAIYLPLAHENKQGLDIALRYSGLALPPPKGMKSIVKKSLLEAAGDDKNRKKRVEKRLDDAGLITKRFGLIKTKKDRENN